MDRIIRVPGSKSYTNRALIMAALTSGPVTLRSPLYSDDTEAMIECLRTLGLKIETEPEQLVVHGDVRSIDDKTYHLFARDSGTTARFLLALLCIVPGVKTLGGTPRLNERPIKDLVDALRELGGRIEYLGKQGQLPVTIHSSKLSGSEVSLKSDLSSQFYSALLLIAPNLQINITSPLVSSSYVKMTQNFIRDWKDNYVIEGDFSSAAYFFAIAALTQSKITVTNLNPASLQPDRKFLDFLAQMGNVISYEENGVCVQGRGVVALDCDMEECPDQVMTMAVLAAFAPGVTQISGIRSLRVKETDRVFAIRNELKKMGIRSEETRDTLTIYGGSPRAAQIETYGDHRIAMAFAVAGMCLPKLTICNPEVVNKTFPTFWKTLKSLQ